MEMAEFDETRDKARRSALSAMNLIAGWLLPWTLATAATIYPLDLLNAQKVLVAATLLFASFLFWKRTGSHGDKAMSRLSIALSWLVAAASLSTVFQTMI